jgi:hypothetical protein
MVLFRPCQLNSLCRIKACSNVPGFVYLALGDPMQKRNYYRAGWLKFKDDADMPEVVKILSEKKVCRHSTIGFPVC